MFCTKKRGWGSAERRVGIVVVFCLDNFRFRLFVGRRLFVRVVRPAVQLLQEEGRHRARLVFHQHLQSGVEINYLVKV